MSLLRSVAATAAIVIGPTYLLFAQPGTNPPPIGILLAAGDISNCDDPKKGTKQDAWLSYANKTAEIIRGVIRDSKASSPPIPVLVLALGDLAYPDGTEEQFDCFNQRWSGFEDALLPVPGNHEYRKKSNYRGEPFFKNFKANSLVNQNGDKKGYFALNFPRNDGPWRLIGLNAYVGGQDPSDAGKEQHRIAMKAQLEWLEANLDMTKEVNRPGCVLAFWHPPTFSSGRHGHIDYANTSPDKALSTARPMQSALRILHARGASVVLAGHEHNYEQFFPHDPDGAAAKDGIRSFVVGTGGSNLTEDYYKKRAPNSDKFFGMKKGVQGVLKIDLFEDRYRWEFLAIQRTKNEKKKTFDLGDAKDNCRTRK